MALRRLLPRAAYGTVAVLKDDGSVWMAVRTHPQQPRRSYGITADLTAADQRHPQAAHALYAPALHTWFYDWCMTGSDDPTACLAGPGRAEHAAPPSRAGLRPLWAE